MDEKSGESDMPIGFAMALAQNVSAMNRFMHLSDGRQDEILEQARRSHSHREMQMLVDHLTDEQGNTAF